MAPESMKAAITETPKPTTQANHDLVNSIWDEARDFGEGVFHGAVESPVNAVVQIVNHVADTHLPPLQITNAKDDNTVAGKIGSFVGTTADMVGLTLATGGIGGAGAVATGLRLAAVGAVYSGVLTPSADNTKNFFADRATSAGVGALTFAAMGAAASGLDALGTVAAPAARTLAESIGNGALVGAVGGAVNAESTATLKEGKLLPGASEFFGDVASYAAFGGALAGATYGIQQLVNPLQHSNINDKQVTVYNDRNGDPVRVDGVTPVVDDQSQHLNWTSMRSSGGRWTTTAEPADDANTIHPAADSPIRSPGGSVDVIGQNDMQRYDSDGTYQGRTLYQHSADAKSAEEAIENARTADVIVNNTDDAGSRMFDYTGRLKQILGPEYDINSPNRADAYIHYDQEGNVGHVEAYSGHHEINFSQQSPGTYEVRVGDSVYNFDGTIKPVASQGNTQPDSLQFTSNDGTSFTYNPSDASTFIQKAKANMKLLPGQGDAPVVKVDEAGNMQISGGHYRTPFINGQKLGYNQSATIKPGDNVAINADIGDSFPDFAMKPLTWGQTADGTPQLQGVTLKPNTTVDVEGDESPGEYTRLDREMDKDSHQ